MPYPVLPARASSSPPVPGSQSHGDALRGFPLCSGSCWPSRSGYQQWHIWISGAEHQEKAPGISSSIIMLKKQCFGFFLHISVSSWLVQTFSWRPMKAQHSPASALFPLGACSHALRYFQERCFFLIFFFIPALTIFHSFWKIDEPLNFY